jgi:hypothetical protein
VFDRQASFHILPQYQRYLSDIIREYERDAQTRAVGTSAAENQRFLGWAFMTGFLLSAILMLALPYQAGRIPGGPWLFPYALLLQRAAPQLVTGEGIWALHALVFGQFALYGAAIDVARRWHHTWLAALLLAVLHAVSALCAA